jgi:divinyl protochlorophyllide a 8-vinyl-reductase
MTGVLGAEQRRAAASPMRERDSTARIGPNAVTRVAEALRVELSEQSAESVFAAAGLLRYLAEPPQAMVDETEVMRLHGALRATLGLETARRVSRRAGELTGDYLLAHRIPKAVQALLRVLPPLPAAHLLLAAIRRHAWTFAGSGRFTAVAARPVRLAIADNPLCRGEAASQPLCDYYAGTFERLFRALVARRTEAVETTCEACGSDACRFELRW